MEELEVLRILSQYNPWWANKEIPPSKKIEFKRGDFYMLQNHLHRREILSIVGPRRVGKTILIYQLIQSLLDSKINPHRILYLSVDDVGLNKGGVTLEEVFNVYSKYVLGNSFDSLSETHYLFLDEIQEIPDWEKLLKNWQDFGYNLKFIISGSSSIWITKGTEESLLGRIKTTVMMPLKFSEILRYKKIVLEEFPKERNELRKAFLDSVKESDLGLFKSVLDKFIGKISNKKNEIQRELTRYLIVGGYPEFLDELDYNYIGESVRDKIKLIFFKDIVRYFRIRNPEVLEDLFKLISKESGMSFNLAKTASLLDIQRPTLRDYLKYLTKAYLIKSAEFFSASRKKRIRKQNKVYVLDAGIRNGMNNYVDTELLKDELELGKVVEGVLFDHLHRLKYNLEPGPESEVFYWRDKKEIDFVISLKRRAIPIESKFRNTISSEINQTILGFIKEHKSPFGIIITKESYKLNGKILEVPLWVFLLMV